MPSLLAEDALHGTRKPCSRTLKALFLHQARPFFEKRGEWLAKYPYIFYLHSQFPVSHKRHFLLSQRTIFSLTKDNLLSHRFTQMNRTHRGQKDSDPSPDPSPEGKGSNHRDTPMGWMQAAFASLLVSSLAVTLCELCMPKAFCGLKLCAKRLRELCALCERIKLPRLRERTPQRVTCVSSHSEGAFYFSQKNTEEQNTQGFTETLSQPISQNLTPTFSYNVL